MLIGKLWTLAHSMAHATFEIWSHTHSETFRALDFFSHAFLKFSFQFCCLFRSNLSSRQRIINILGLECDNRGD